MVRKKEDEDVNISSEVPPLDRDEWKWSERPKVVDRYLDITPRGFLKQICKNGVVDPWKIGLPQWYERLAHPAVAKTENKYTCTHACNRMGLDCMRGNDNEDGKNGGCDLWNQHVKYEANGCNEKWYTQICQCGSKVDAGIRNESLQGLFVRLNQYRCVHNAQKLSWDKGLVDKAQVLASRIRSTNKLEIEHGRQLVMAALSDGAQALEEQAYAQIRHTNGGRMDRFNPEASGYSLIVWAETTKVGCAADTMRYDGRTYNTYVCEFDQGNLQGAFSYQVKPPTRGEEVCPWYF